MDEDSSSSNSSGQNELEEAEEFLRVRACLAEHEAFAPEPPGILDRRAQQALVQQQQKQQLEHAADTLPEEQDEQQELDRAGDESDVDSMVMDGSMMALDNSMCFASPR